MTIDLLLQVPPAALILAGIAYYFRTGAYAQEYGEKTENLRIYLLSEMVGDASQAVASAPPVPGRAGSHNPYFAEAGLDRLVLQRILTSAKTSEYERIAKMPERGNTYLRATGQAAESPAIARDLASAPDRSRFIAESALRPLGADPLCAATLDLFVSILAAEAANLALRVLATGGVYLAGGIAPQLLPLLEGGAFMKAFVRKGRLEELLRRVPVHVIMRRAALPGAATRGLELMAAGLESV